MGWSYGEVDGRPVGYSVPDVCNHPECDVAIDRGLSYACGDMPGDGMGCDGFFCWKHLLMTGMNREQGLPTQLCFACLKRWQVCAECGDGIFGPWSDAAEEGWTGGEPGSIEDVTCPKCHGRVETEML